MLLSHRYNFLFVHIAKTGGTSVRAALNRLSTWQFSAHFSSAFVPRRHKIASWKAFATGERAGIADTMSSTPTERKPIGAYH